MGEIHGKTFRTGLAFVLAGMLGLPLFAAPRADTAEEIPQRLFRIERSTNANIVVYDAQLTRDGTLDAHKPVVAYWLLLASDGARDKLTLLEKKFAYGFKARFVDPTTVVLKLSANIGREITVSAIHGAWHAVTEIDGHAAILDRIFVKSIDKKLWPSVEYVELFGVDAVNGQARYERVYR